MKKKSAYSNEKEGISCYMVVQVHFFLLFILSEDMKRSSVESTKMNG